MNPKIEVLRAMAEREQGFARAKGLGGSTLYRQTKREHEKSAEALLAGVQALERLELLQEWQPDTIYFDGGEILDVNRFYGHVDDAIDSLRTRKRVEDEEP